MPEIKLAYFDEIGGGEMIRLALAIGGIPFTDERIQKHQWKQRKPLTPYGVLPTLTVDGEEMAQEMAILRYSGRLAGLYPSDPMEAFRVDEVIITVQEFAGKAIIYKGNDRELLKASRLKYVAEVIPTMFASLEKRITKWGEGPWAVGDSPTIADTALYSLVLFFKSGELEFLPKNALDRFPRTMAVYSAVSKLPAVIRWNESHATQKSN